MQFNQILDVPIYDTFSEPKQNEVVEATITPQVISDLFQKGVWISSFFYYFDKEGELQRSRQMSFFFPRKFNPDDIHNFLIMVKSYHRVHIEFDSIYDSYPLDEMNPKYYLLNQKPIENVDPYEQLEAGSSLGDFLDFRTGMTPLEVEEVLDELESTTIEEISEVKDRSKPYCSKDDYRITSYSYLLVLIKELSPLIPYTERLKILLYYKRTLYAMMYRPVQYSVLGLDIYYRLMVETGDKAFGTQEESIVFPSRYLKRMRENFRGTPQYEQFYFYYLTWEETYNLRLVSKNFYIVAKDLLLSLEAYFVFKENYDSVPFPTTDLSSFRTQNFSTYRSLERRDGRCIRCHKDVDSLCGCLSLSLSDQDYYSVIYTFFKGHNEIRHFVRYMTRLPRFSTELIIALAAIHCEDIGIDYDHNYRYLMSQLPRLFMEEIQCFLPGKLVRVEGIYHLNGTLLTNDKKMVWKGRLK